MRSVQIAAAVLGFMTVVFGPAASLAQGKPDFPTRPVTIVVPFAAGGGLDLSTRLLADILTNRWKQQVLVENRPGGGTITGISQVARSKPDGYTLGTAAMSMLINPALRTSMPYDTLKDITGIGVLSYSPFMIAANAKLPASNVAELVALAKSGRTLSFASTGIGGANHMMVELLLREAGVKMTHVPYGGSSQAMPDVVTGRVDLITDGIAAERPHIQSGALKPIAIGTPKRIAEFPNVPTIAETYPNVIVVGLNTLIAPSGIPKDVLDFISSELQAIVASKDYKDKITAHGSQPPEPTTVAETNEIYRKELERWRQVASDAGIKVEQ